MVDEKELRLLLSVGETERRAHDVRLAPLIALANEMGDSPPQRESPVREVMARLGDNWSALILKVLSTGTYRHATLKRTIAALSAEGSISQRMLTLRLRGLERDGLVTRTTTFSVPARVDYKLTPLGHALTAQLGQVISWIENHEAEIIAARESFSED